MKIYVRKIDSQCINKQISYTHEILDNFLDGLNDHDYIKCIGKKSQFTQNVQLLLATDPRFNNSLKLLLNKEGLLEEGDIMVMYKLKDYYEVELLKPHDEKFAVLSQLIPTNDRHLLINLDASNENPLKDTIKRIYDSKSFNYQDVSKKYERFQNLYGKNALLSLEGKDLLYRLFAKKSMNEDSLIYQLEHGSDYYYFGGIKGGSAYKFSLFYSNKNNSWIYGSNDKKNQKITEEEAIKLATHFRDNLISVINKIESYIDGDFVSDINYINIEKEAKDKLGNLYCRGWILKYLHLIFPNLFTNMMSDEWFAKIFNLLELDNKGSCYEKNYRFSKFAHELNIPNIYLYNIALELEEDESINVDNETECQALYEDVLNEMYTSDFSRNLIFFGAPGTGKSYELNNMKNKLLADGGDYERVTFHPEYSYSDFVGTYKPVSTKIENRNIIEYKFVPGPFLRLYVKAVKNLQSFDIKPALLIIEEINRANVSSVFGDLFQLLDRNDIEVSEYPIHTSEDVRDYLQKELGGTVSDYEYIKLPSNLFIWATMNSADQGVFPIDTAFKRRWEFKYISINNKEDSINNLYAYMGEGENRILINWNKLRHLINDFLTENCKCNEDKLIGPYFISKKILDKGSLNNEGKFILDDLEFKKAFKNKVLMYLFEDAAKQRRTTLFPVLDGKIRYSYLLEQFKTLGVYIFAAQISNNI